jgi:hypothetical protein
MSVSETLDPDGWINRVSESELMEREAKRLKRRQQRGELTRLTKYMAGGGLLVRDELPGVGVVYRALRVCTVAPFSPAAVERWCVREGKPLPDPAESEAQRSTGRTQ